MCRYSEQLRTYIVVPTLYSILIVLHSTANPIQAKKNEREESRLYSKLSI